MKQLFFTLFAMVSTMQIQAQDTINLMNGLRLLGKINNIEDFRIDFTENRKGKQDQYMVDNFRVFSYQKSTQTPVVVYEYDTNKGNFLTRDEMRYFIYGERDARENHKAWATAGIGFVVGGLGGALFYDRFFVVGVPFAFTVGAGAFRGGVKLKNVTNKRHLTQDAYWEGYRKISKSKRLFKGFLGSALGTITGALIVNAINQ